MINSGNKQFEGKMYELNSDQLKLTYGGETPLLDVLLPVGVCLSSGPIGLVAGVKVATALKRCTDPSIAAFCGFVTVLSTISAGAIAALYLWEYMTTPELS